MTTIAYKDGILAVDSRETIHTEAGGTRVFNNCIKAQHDEEKNIIVAHCGDSAEAQQAQDWYLSKGRKKKPEFEEGVDFALYILKKKGLFYMGANLHEIQLHEEYYADGSGVKIALGAMYAGASAVDAVEAAAEHDPYTGGKIRAYSLK